MTCIETRHRKFAVPILALHGSASSGRQWRALAETLAGSRPVVAPDLAGYGPGGIAELDELDDRFAPLEDLLRSFDQPVHLVGIPLAALSRSI